MGIRQSGPNSKPVDPNPEGSASEPAGLPSPQYDKRFGPIPPLDPELVALLTGAKLESARFVDLGAKIGQLCTDKNIAYGDSFGNTGEFLKLLYPKGISPEQYEDSLLLARIFDKLSRIANQKSAFNESPYIDIAGYAILGAAKDGVKL